LAPDQKSTHAAHDAGKKALEEGKTLQQAAVAAGMAAGDAAITIGEDPLRAALRAETAAWAFNGTQETVSKVAGDIAAAAMKAHGANDLEAEAAAAAAVRLAGGSVAQSIKARRSASKAIEDSMARGIFHPTPAPSQRETILIATPSPTPAPIDKNNKTAVSEAAVGDFHSNLERANEEHGKDIKALLATGVHGHALEEALMKLVNSHLTHLQTLADTLIKRHRSLLAPSRSLMAELEPFHSSSGWYACASIVVLAGVVLVVRSSRTIADPKSAAQQRPQLASVV
jgi:hypothetical protein